METILPIAPQTFWGFVAFGAALALSAVVFAILPRTGAAANPLNALQARLGLSGWPPPVAFFAIVLWGALMAILTVGLVGLIWDVGWNATHSPGDRAAQWDFRFKLAQMAALTAVLGAMIAVPITLQRLQLTQRQTKAAEERLTTELINTAVEGLGAEKTVSRIGRVVQTLEGDNVVDTHMEWQGDPPITASGTARKKVGDWQAFAQTKPNLEVRIGAILSLERIAQDSARDHNSIMEILCAYIRENAPASQFAKPALEENERYPDNSAIEDWARNLQTPRTDIQTALTVIGRRSAAQIELERAAKAHSNVGYRLDLRETCLQRADMATLNFDHAMLAGAQLQGAFLIGAQLQGADLREAQLQGAGLTFAQLQGAELRDAQLQGAELDGAQLQRAELHGARFDAATLLVGASLRGARLAGVDCTTARFSQDQIDSAFGDASVILGNLQKPDHWDQSEKPRHPAKLWGKWRAWQRSIGQDPDTPR